MLSRNQRRAVRDFIWSASILAVGYFALTQYIAQLT